MSTVSRSSRPGIPVILLFGPTAVGKTDLVVELFAGRAEVVNADSMQVYRGMDIGTAKPPRALVDRIPHHLIDIRDPDEGYSVGDFVEGADDLVPQIVARGRDVLISGGSAFYLRTFIYGLPETPRVDRRTKEQLAIDCEERGLDALRAELERVDPSTAERLPGSDRYRIVRALEVYRATGSPLSSFTVASVPRDNYRFCVIGLERPRSELYRRIDDRVDAMMERGLLGEVEGLVASGCRLDSQALRAIGYRELAAHLRGEYTLERAVELVKRNSRRYAKRQITFFKQLPGVQWFEPDALGEIRAAIESFLEGGPGAGLQARG